MEIVLSKPKKRGRARYYLLLIVSFLAVISLFTFMKGDTLINLDNKTMEMVLPIVQPAYHIESQLQYTDFDGRVDLNISNQAVVEDMAKAMENDIHIILFAVQSLICSFVFRKLRFKTLNAVALTVLLCSLVAYFSEVLQNSVFHRGYENIDVKNNMIGIGVGLSAFLLVTAVRALTKKKHVNRKITFEF